MIYFAYGSNLCIDHMKRRCPDAVPLGKFSLRSSRLVFRGVADCVYDPATKCPGGLWRISKENEETLDSYEGINSGSYRKEFCKLTGYPGEEKLLLYVMNSTGIEPPSERYFDIVRQGYRDFKLPLRHLDMALKAAWEERNPSHRERHRHERSGRPRLARLKFPAKAGKTGSSTTGNQVGLFEQESV